MEIGCPKIGNFKWMPWIIILNESENQIWKFFKCQIWKYSDNQIWILDIQKWEITQRYQKLQILNWNFIEHPKLEFPRFDQNDQIWSKYPKIGKQRPK